MDWKDIGWTTFALVSALAALAGWCALAAGVLVGLSKRLVGFRVPFMAAFKAVAATVVVTMLLRVVGGPIGKAISFGVGWAVMLAGVIYFLAWYFDRFVQRPDGTPFGRADGYRLAVVYALLTVFAGLTALAVIDPSQVS
jgi:hypothetical protein